MNRKLDGKHLNTSEASNQSACNLQCDKKGAFGDADGKTATGFRKPRIRNVVCTADLAQKIDIAKLAKMPCGIYDDAIYGGRCGYVKTPGMDGRVTVFRSGKMISVGGKSTKKAIEQLNHAKFYLVEKKMAKDVRLVPAIRNIVATVEIGKYMPIDVLSTKIRGATYDPETFPGMLIKGINSCSFTVFASGKMIVVGAKSHDELYARSFEMIQRLNDLGKT